MYRFVRGVEPNSYIFFTDNAVVYDVFFVKVDYFYQYPIFADNVYELVIKAPNDAPQDRLTSATIAAIFLDFIDSEDKIVIYTCDLSDKREKARNRKFDDWFSRYNKGRFIKIGHSFEDISTSIYTSLILDETNPHKLQVINAFNELITEFDNKD
ncbi:MAG: DUF6169 family protein [Spirosomataceae bacterium]